MMKGKGTMKKFGVLLLVCICLPVWGAWSDQEVYCRYQAGDTIFYGRVYNGDVIHQLSAAPWDGGKETGHIIDVKSAKLLHPSEPKIIFGISGSYKEAWPEGKKPFNTIRWFLKPPTSAAASEDDIILPASLDTLLVETELVAVIGKTIRNGSLEEAKEAIFGYTAGNDIVGDVTSYHRIQKEPLDQVETLLAPGLKIGDRFAPYGPFIYRGVDWKNRNRTLRITNEKTGKNLFYEHNTSNMLFPPEKIVSDLSRVVTLNPGDIIFTGTTKALPAEDGDLMEVTVEGLGKTVNRVRSQ